MASDSRSPAHRNDPAVIREALTTPATWAVVGLSQNRGRTAYRIADFLVSQLDMRVVPVHPDAPTVFGQQGYAVLGDIPDGTVVEVVDFFVRSQLVGAVVDEAIAQRERLGIRTLWLQLGVIDHPAAARAEAAGLQVIMDTCPKMEWPLP
jgi:predicted CoA-binding protein